LRKTSLRFAAAAVALAVVGTACGGNGNGGGNGSATPAAAPTASATTGAATLRAGLTGLLTEHVYLAALATGAALRGDNAGFEAFANALNGPSNSNTSDLVAAIGSAYGADVGRAFEGLWRSEGHIPAVVAYTQAVAANNRAGADKAVNDLLAYAKTFGTTLNSVNANLPAAAVEEAIKMHATTLKAVIDAQAAKDAARTATSLRTAVGHMSETATVLADATVKKFPERF
jgi:hypothetical protein